MADITIIDAVHHVVDVYHDVDKASLTCRCGVRAEIQLTSKEIREGHFPSLLPLAQVMDEHIRGAA